MKHLVILAVGIALSLSNTPMARSNATDQLVGKGFAARFALLGQVQPRPASAIEDNDWSVGAETIDRDYSTYSAWHTYLGPLGVKRARLQSGWWRTDLGDGKYDFAWLDPIVDDMRAQGVHPWLSLSYGNDRYPGGGVARRDSPLPTDAGRAAWLAYVRATVTHYRGRVNEYEIWNEPDLNVQITAEGYGRFAYETAREIKAADPDAKIILGAFAASVWNKTEFFAAREFANVSLREFVRLGGKGLASAVTYHAYRRNPDEVYQSLPSFIAMIKEIDPNIQARQGESGAPSLNQPHFALGNMWWTEQGQAKWLLRRMLGDAAHAVPSSIFAMTEMHYPVAAETGLAFHGPSTNEKPAHEKPAAASSKNFKGLLETRLYAPDTSEDDRTVVRTKMGYTAMQAVTSIFDAGVKPVQPASYTCAVTGPKPGSVSAYAFRRADGATALALWRSDAIPDTRPGHELADVRCAGLRFSTRPRYVDLLTRAVYETRDLVSVEGEGVWISALPIYDSPVLIADAALVTPR